MLWVAASYHFPSTYSIRVPMSSETHARALPTPGPATVRLALIHTSVEVFGSRQTQDILFPLFQTIKVCIQPPEQVTITQHQTRGYKRQKAAQQNIEVLQETLLQREMLHAQGNMTVYLQVPVKYKEWYMTLLSAIGYWGQSSSLATCVHIEEKAPRSEECMMSVHALSLLSPQGRLQPWFSSLASEFRRGFLRWDEVTSRQTKQPVLQLDVYIWPLKLVQQDANGKHFVRQAFDEKEEMRRL